MFTSPSGVTPRWASLRRFASACALLGVWACASEDASDDDGGDTAGAPSAGAGASTSAGSGGKGGGSGRGGAPGTGGDAIDEGEGGGSGSDASSGAPSAGAGHHHGHGGSTNTGDAGTPSVDAGGRSTSDAGGGGVASDGGGAGAPSDADAGHGGSPSSEPEPPELNGCTEYEDRTAVDASREIPWDGSLPLHAERCMKIRLGDAPIFVGDFEEHPLAALGGDEPSPFSTTPWAFDRPGVFGYYCTVHPEMLGTIWVVP